MPCLKIELKYSQNQNKTGKTRDFNPRLQTIKRASKAATSGLNLQWPPFSCIIYGALGPLSVIP